MVCAASVAAAVYLWGPGFVVEGEPEDLAQARKDYGWAFQLGVGFLGLLAYWCLAVALSSLIVFFHPSYYFRAGPGGLSVRVPNGPCLSTLGLTVNLLEFDMPWDEIQRWWIVEERPLGGVSRSCYSYPSFVNVKTFAGEEFSIPTEYFRESPNIIVSKITDAQEMEVPTFDEEICADAT